MTIAFLQKSTGPNVDLLEPLGREKLDPINTAGIPEIDFLSVSGPFNQRGPGDTPTPPRDPDLPARGSRQGAKILRARAKS